MTREEFYTLVKGLRASYQKQGFLEKREDAEIWFKMLEDLPYKAAGYAVQKHIMTNKFPPTIAEIREAAIPDTTLNAQEAWSLVMKAISNGIYNAKSEYDKLPPACKKAIGSPDVIHSLALEDAKTLMSVQQSHFMRTYAQAVERERELEKLPGSVKELLQITAERTSA